MQWSYSMLEERVRSYQSRYPNPSAKVVLHLLWWNFRQLLRKSKNTPAQAKPGVVQAARPQAKPAPATPASNQTKPAPVQPVRGQANLALQPDVLNVGFLLNGGLGDFIVAANYLYKFRQKYKDIPMRLDVFAHNSFETALSVFESGGLVDHLYTEEGYDGLFRSYDVFVKLSRYPDIKRRNTERISSIAPEVLEYVFACERFREEHHRFFRHPGITDGQSAMLCLLKEKKRLNQPDVYGFLDVSLQYEYELPLQANENAYLKTLQLLERPFITLHRGADTRYSRDGVKLWPLSYYAVLIRLLKKRFPHITTVQLGISHDRCPEIKGVDLNLVGQTNLEEVKILLKHSLLHIDGEGGFVHLRYAMHAGPSAVLFGPTEPEFFGYLENLNLRGSGCNATCEWMTHEWLGKCLRGCSYPPCMASLIPERVFERLSPVLDTLLRTSAIQGSQN